MKSIPAWCLFFCWTGWAAAQEWTRFRGPGGTGVSEKGGFPEKIAADSWAWKVELPGAGVSSPVVWKSKVFLTSESDKPGERLLLALDAESGRELWRVTESFAEHGKHSFNSFASSTPCVDAERIYLAGTSGGTMRVRALSHEGKPLWQVDAGAYGEDHGSGVSPILAGGVLVLCKDNALADSCILGLNPADGAVMWRHPRQSVRTPFATPVVIPDGKGGEAVLIPGNPKALTCLGAADGKLLWEVENPSAGDRPVASPVMSGDICFMSAGQGGTGKASVSVRVTDPNPDIAWQLKKGIPYVPTGVGTADRLYLLGDGGILTCVRSADGSVVYSERVFADKAYSSPVMAGDRIFCVGRSGKIAVVAAGDTFRIVGEGDLGEAADATPAISGGRMFFRTNTHLLALKSQEAPRP